MPYQITAEQLERVWEMPELSHYPDRSKKFDFANSDVIKFLMRTLDATLADATKAFEKLRRSRDIVYDPTQKRWMGKSLMAPAQEAE